MFCFGFIVSIFVVLELLSDVPCKTRWFHGSNVSIFVVLELLSDPCRSVATSWILGFNLCCVRTSFWLNHWNNIESFTDVSIFVVLELLSDSAVGKLNHAMMMCFNLCCVRTSFWLRVGDPIDDSIYVSIFVVLELLSDIAKTREMNSGECFNLCCVRTSFWPGSNLYSSTGKMRFNLCCVRTSFWQKSWSTSNYNDLVSIFVVLELLSDFFTRTIYYNRFLVSIFVVLELLSDILLCGGWMMVT